MTLYLWTNHNVITFHPRGDGHELLLGVALFVVRIASDKACVSRKSCISPSRGRVRYSAFQKCYTLDRRPRHVEHGKCMNAWHTNPSRSILQCCYVRHVIWCERISVLSNTIEKPAVYELIRCDFSRWNITSNPCDDAVKEACQNVNKELCDEGVSTRNGNHFVYALKIREKYIMLSPLTFGTYVWPTVYSAVHTGALLTVSLCYTCSRWWK